MTYSHRQYRQYPTAAGLRDSRRCGVRVSVCSAYPRADPGLVNGGQGRGAAGAEGGGGVPLPKGEGSGEGLCPLPRNFLNFYPEMAHFYASAAVILGSENAWRTGSVGFLS